MARTGVFNAMTHSIQPSEETFPEYPGEPPDVKL